MKDYIDKVIELARISNNNGDVPVGAIVVKDGQIIGEGYNTKEINKDILGHAEINAIKKACRKVDNWNLHGSFMVVSLKPCSMCEKIIRQCRIDKVFYLLEKPNNKKEYYKTNFEIIDSKNDANEYAKILSNFFTNLREK